MDDEKKGTTTTITSNLDDPEKISEPKLRAIISEVGIELPSNYQTRSYLVSVYNANKERIIEHFKQKHRRKSDSSIVIPDDIPVEPYVEPGPDLRSGARGAAALPLTASKRPGQPQESKVEKKKAKKANPFQSKKDKTKINQTPQPQRQVAASPLPRNTHQGGSATITIPQIDFSQVFPKSPAPGQPAAMVDENQKALQGFNANITGSTRNAAGNGAGSAAGSRSGGSYSTTIMFPQFQPQTPVQSIPASTPLCATHQQHRYQSPQQQSHLFQSQAQPKPRSQLFQSQIIQSPQPQTQQQQQQQQQPPTPMTQTQPQQPPMTQYQQGYPNMNANVNMNMNMSTNMNTSGDMNVGTSTPSYYCCTPYTQRVPNAISPKPVGFSPFPAATPIGTTTPAPMIQQQQQPQQLPPLTQQQAPPTITSYQYPGSVTKLGEMSTVDALFPPSSSGNVIIGGNNDVGGLGSAPADNSNALPDDLIFGAKAQQPLSSFSEPPNTFGCSQSSYNYNNNTNSPNNSGISKPAKAKKDNTVLYIILFFLVILAGMMLRSLLSPPKIEFCVKSDVFMDTCEPCPENAICTNGTMRCRKNHILVDGIFCLKRDQFPGYEFAKRARDVLEAEKYRHACGDVKTERLTLDELIKRCGDGINQDDAKEALRKYYAVLGIKTNSGHSGTYSAQRERINRLSMCYLRSKYRTILVGLAVVLSFCLLAYFFVTTRNNTRKAKEMREKVVDLLADARSRARRGVASNDDFLSLANLRCEIVSSSKWSKSRAVQAQWKLAVKLLEKDPRVTKTTIYSNGRNVTGFKLK